MTDQQEVSISDIHGSLARDSPDVYITFRVGDEHAETQVIKNATERISWSEPVTVPANEGGRGSRAKNSDLLVVRAYDKKPLMPDALLGEATVELSNLSLADSHVAGSGGGSNVQVQLLGKGDKFGGALTFTVTSTEGSSVPGGKTWGPQEVHDGQTTAAAGALPAAGTERRSSSNVGDHASTGFTGGGATAFPAQESGKDLHGEHLADFEKGAAGSAAGIGGGAAGLGSRSVEQGDVTEQAPQGTGIVGAVKSALGYGTPSEQQQYTSASSSSAGNQGGGIVGGVKSALGYGTPAEQHQGVTGQEGAHGTTGFGGSGATAFPAQESGKDLHGEHLSDFGKGAAGAGAGAGAAAAFGSHDRSVEQGGVNEQQGGGIVASVKSALGYGTPAEQQQATTASGTSTGNQGGGYLQSAKQALGLGATPTTTTTQGQQQETVGPTAGVTGGGAEARPAEAAGVELGLHLSDYDNQKGSSHATGAGAGGAAAGAAAAALGLAGSGHQGADSHQGGLGSVSGSSSQTGALHEGGAALGGGTASRSPLGGLGTAAGSTGQTGSLHEGGAGLAAGSDTRSPAALSSADTAASSSGRTGMLREGGVAACHDGSGQTAHLHTHNEPAVGITGAGRSGESGLATGAGQQAAPRVGGGTGADGASKEQLFLATGIAGATHEGGLDTATAAHGSSGDRGLAAGHTPAAGAATGATAGSHTAGQPSSQSDGVLYISGIGGKLARHEDTLGHVSPYFVFEVGRERATTATHKKGIKTLEALTWDDNLELELPQGGASQELHVIAYNKKHLLPDSRLGEARARLDQLPRGRQARLNLIDHKTRGNMAGDVEFTLTGGGPGGEGAGQDLGMVEGAVGLSTTEHEGVASGALPPFEERRAALVAEREEKHAEAKAAKGK